MVSLSNLFDWSDEKSIKKATKTIKSKFSKIDILINNAGTLLNLPFIKSSIEEFKKVGLDTAKAVLELEAEDLLKRTDLEEETINEVIGILKEEFEE